MTTAYLGLDLHASTCTLGIMADDGTYQGHQHFPTAESELIPRVVEIKAQTKRLALEEGTLARWAARTLEPYVDEVFVCDPRENALISRSPRKSDAADAYQLCRLLRLGELGARLPGQRGSPSRLQSGGAALPRYAWATSCAQTED